MLDHQIIEEIEKLRRQQNPNKYPPKEPEREQPTIRKDEPTDQPKQGPDPENPERGVVEIQCR